ncbi:MAG: hypothetical protein P8123_03295, partial [bacterium]
TSMMPPMEQPEGIRSSGSLVPLERMGFLMCEEEIIAKYRWAKRLLYLIYLSGVGEEARLGC